MSIRQVHPYLLKTMTIFLALGGAWSCVYKLGTSKDFVGTHAAGSAWNHAFQGDDWEGLDAKNNPWVCKSGMKQSPLSFSHLGALTRGNPALRTSWAYKPLTSNGTNLEVINNGHTIQVEWLYDYTSSVQIATVGKTVTDKLGMSGSETISHVKATPAQFHFHANSEHMIEGEYFPLELHIVHKVTDLPNCSPCYSVTGIMFKLDPEDKDNEVLAPIFNNMGYREGEKKFFPADVTIDVGALLPANHAYVSYEGSLTTPPCSEGLLWHVFLQPQTISSKQLAMYQRAVGDKNCDLKASTTANTTEAHTSTTEATRRHLLAHDHHHEHEHEAGHESLGQAYAHVMGQMRLVTPQGRVLMAEEPVAHEAGHEDPEAYNCTIIGYGYNFRKAQPANGRVIKFFEDAGVTTSSSVRLEGANYNDLMASPARMSAFKSAFKERVAAAVGVTASDVEITSLASGSVVVNYAVNFPSAVSTQAAAAAMVQNMQDRMESVLGSTFMTDFGVKSAVAGPIVSGTGSAATAASFADAKAHDDLSFKMKQLGIGLGVGLGVPILITMLVALALLVKALRADDIPRVSVTKA